MNTNVTQVGTTYNFNVAEGDYIFNGNCEQRLDSININGSISFKALGNDNGEMAGNQYIGSFNYSFRENAVDFNTNINDKDSADEILGIIISVVSSIKQEVSVED